VSKLGGELEATSAIPELAAGDGPGRRSFDDESAIGEATGVLLEQTHCAYAIPIANRLLSGSDQSCFRAQSALRGPGGSGFDRRRSGWTPPRDRGGLDDGRRWIADRRRYRLG
jgi:hypothetical protein